MKTINFYKTGDKFGCFSNFSSHPIEVEGLVYRTSEHYFQAIKFLDPKLQSKAREIESPMKVALFGRDRSLPLRPDWEEVKDDVMRRAVFCKVVQNKEVFDTLVSTKDFHIVEHTSNDSYWADGGDGSGKNMLGIILMEVRNLVAEAGQKIKLEIGDITRVQSDAIVNAANKSLTGGGGVDGAIHRAAGPEMKDYCAKYKGCKTGEVRPSGPYNLDCKYVFHAVGPTWQDGLNNEEEKLYKCYSNSMSLAKEMHCNSIAFPNISTGAYKFPFEKASSIQRFALTTKLMTYSTMEFVKVVSFSQNDYNRALKTYSPLSQLSRL